MKYLKKIIILILIQAFLVMNTAWAGGFELVLKNKAIESTLSPQVAIDVNAFKHSYAIYAQKRFLTGDIALPQGVISFSDILENGTIISKKTTNFRIGKNSFRVPPYLAGRIARLHITDINRNGFEFQKMGIGVGRRKKTIAVILVDISDADNQLLIFEDKGEVKLKRLGVRAQTEMLSLGEKARFGAMDRQDSFLERSALGIDFLNRALGIGQAGSVKPYEVAAALKNLAFSNPKLEKELLSSLAFFSKDYMLTFSEGLRRYSHIAVLRDREQRGRFIAIIDKLNPDNLVVFERRREQVCILGENERVVIPKLQKHKKTQVFYFTDIEEGAQFCRNVTRELIEIDFPAKSHSISIRKGVQLNVGSNNPDLSVLKVNQVTQSTVTGYQIKKRAPEFIEEIFATYPVYILRDDFKREISVNEVEVDYESADFMFFDASQQKKWSNYLSFGNAEEPVYYQHLKGTYFYQGREYVVYRAMTRNDILASLSFSNDGSFTIKGINWKDGEPVVFRNIKNIALCNIVTQLNSSRFVDIDPVLKEYFDVSNLETGLNPVRSTYRFKNGVFEQGPNLKMEGVIDFTEIQKKEDKKIGKSRKFIPRIPKAALILSVFSLVFTAQSLFAADLVMKGLSDLSAFGQALDSYYFDSLLAGLTIILGMLCYRIVRWGKNRFRSITQMPFNPSRRDFIYTASIEGLIGFLILQTGMLAFSRIYSQMKDSKLDSDLRPQMINNLKQLAIIFENMPDSMYADNKRLFLPMTRQYWQLYLQLTPEQAEKAAQIYTESYQFIFNIYAKTAPNIPRMNSVQLLRFIIAHIEGSDVFIQEEIPSPSEDPSQDEKMQVNVTTVGGAAVGGIIPIRPISPVQKVKYEKKQREYKKSTGEKPPKGKDISISSRGKLLSGNLDLLRYINNSVNNNAETYFSLKNKAEDQETTFVIRPLKNIEEAKEFQDLLSPENNFNCVNLFKMQQDLKEYGGAASPYIIYGVFMLDKYGKEEQIVGAADYLIREISGLKCLNLTHLEVLPKLRKSYSGIGRALFVKVISDALREGNLQKTEGRVVFQVENKGRGKDLLEFYRDSLGLSPKSKKIPMGSMDETVEFELSLEELLEFMRREFSNIGFSAELNVAPVDVIKSDVSDKLKLRQPISELVGQSI